MYTLTIPDLGSITRKLGVGTDGTGLVDLTVSRLLTMNWFNDPVTLGQEEEKNGDNGGDAGLKGLAELTLVGFPSSSSKSGNADAKLSPTQNRHLNSSYRNPPSPNSKPSTQSVRVWKRWKWIS
jgi:hypothetical protein